MSDELRECPDCGQGFWLRERALLDAGHVGRPDDGIGCPRCGSLDHRRLPMLSDYGLPVGGGNRVPRPAHHEDDPR